MKTAIQVMTAVLVLAFATGCGNDGSSPCDNAFCVGLLFPTNDDRPFATPLISGAEEARDDINAAGIDEFFGDVVLVRGEEGVENRSAVETTLDTARDILGRGVRGFVGPTYSSSFEKEYPSRSYANFFDFLTKERIVTVSPSATSSSLTELSRNAREGNRFFFRTAPSNDLWAKVIAGEATDATGTVLIVYRDDTFGDNLRRGVQSEIEELARGPSVETVSYEPYGPDDPAADAKASEVASDVKEEVKRIDDVSYVIVIAFDEVGKIIAMLRSDPNAIPDDVTYHVAGTGSARLGELINPDDPAAGRAETSGFVVSGPEEGYNDEAYDAVVIMALAALAAGSTDPAEYVSRMAAVTKGGTPCSSYARCAALLTDGDASNDNIDYCGHTGPIELDENGDPTVGYFAVNTHDASGNVGSRRTLDADLNEADAGAKCAAR